MSIQTASTPVQAGAGTSRRGVVLAVILVCQLMIILDATIVNVALPKIQSALGFSTANLSWVINAYALTFGGLLLLGARAGDVLGRRRTFLAGIALFTLASLAGGFAQTSGALLAARAIQGVGAALAAPSALALLTTMFPEGRERMRALGYYTAVSIGGSAVGLVAGGILTEWASWRWVMFVNVPIGIVLLLAAWRVLPETARHQGRFDLLGALTSTLGMASLVYGFVQAATDGWGAQTTVIAFTAGVVLLVVFVLNELRAPSPITPLRLFTNRNRSVSYVARLLLVAGMFGMFFFLTQFLQDVLGYSPLITGLGFLPLTAMLFIASQASARLSGRALQQAPDVHRVRALRVGSVLDQPPLGRERLPLDPRSAADRRAGQRDGLRAADGAVAQRGRPEGRRCRLGTGERDPAGRGCAGARGPGDRVRDGQPLVPALGCARRR